MLTILTLVGWTLFQGFGPNPRIVVSPETTVITSPLRDDGLPDYQAHWRDLGREGVTPENNGAVLFWKATWPGELGNRDWQPMCDALGIEQMPNTWQSLQDPYSDVVRQLIAFWLTEQYQADQSDEVANEFLNDVMQKEIRNIIADDIVGECQTRPWRSEQVPPLADWIKQSEHPFRLLTEATNKPRWWSPSPSMLRDEYDGGIAMLLPAVQRLRSVTRAFSIRAMWHLGEGRPEAAWEDLTTSLRLARITAKGSTLVEQLIAIAIDNIALRQAVAIVSHGEPNAKFARQVLDDLMALEIPSDVMRSFSEGERVFYADTVVMLAEGSSKLEGLGLGEPIERLGLLGWIRIDWNLVLRTGNMWYDRLIESGDQPDYQQRRIAYVEFESDINQLTSNSLTPGRVAASIFSTRARSALIADVMVSLMLPALDAATRAEDRALVRLDLTRLAVALAVYRAEQGEYPERLEQLVPDIIAHVPEDLYSGNPLKYELKADGGYLLYSVFENGTDDGGTDYSGEIARGEWLAEVDHSIDYDQSDIVIRVPTPEFKMPDTPEFLK